MKIEISDNPYDLNSIIFFNRKLDKKLELYFSPAYNRQKLIQEFKEVLEIED